MADKELEKEYITEKEARTVKELFKKNLKSYKEKDASMTDEEWLEDLFNRELSDIISPGEAKQDAAEIVGAIKNYDENLKSVNEAAEKGISKESWLAGKIEEASAGMAVNEYGKTLQSIDNMLYRKNEELAEALQRSADGHIKMSPNLDGNIAEHMIADTAEISGFVQGKNVKVEVREAYTANSVDVRATDMTTGKYQNYQLKFGQDAKTTIALIERGNYNNQRIIVPKEQLEEVKAYFESIGSDKTITDHIEIAGAVGKSYTKEEMKAIQTAAQEKGVLPELDYNHIQRKDMLMSIGKNAGALALQSMAVTTGINIIGKVCKGEPVDADELVESAIRTGADTSVKVVAAGTLKEAVGKGALRFIPKTTPASVIANIACVGIENAKILWKIAKGELSLTKGIDHMGRTTVSMAGGFCGMAAVGTALTPWIPVVGPVLGVATWFVGSMVGYFGGSKIGDCIYSAGKTVAKAAGGLAKAAWEGVKSVGRGVVSVVKGIGSFIFG
ncbi:MAG: hypothetical protein NC321_02695 [Clostridium sp.]|nr:hypothetical protein [Clostridium sp.]